MKLEDHVCSLELAKRLKELNVKQYSIFWHTVTKIEFCGVENHSISDKIPNNEFSKEIDPRYDYYSAFTASELFELLPACVDIKKDAPFNFYWLHMQKRVEDYQYMLNYRCDTFGSHDIFQRTLAESNICDEKLEDALAKMLIHLIEYKFIEIENA